eukprot:401816-Pyramimonas_sp.AAC.1
MAQIATGTTCRICLKDFNTLNRVLKHAKASKTCASSWLHAGQRPTDQEHDANKQEQLRIQRSNEHLGLLGGTPACQSPRCRGPPHRTLRH